jgi:hypothetical protein
MDASERIEQQRIENLREDILHTRESIVQNIDRLQDAVQAEVSALGDPFHIRERIQQRPLLACAVAIGLGVLVSQARTRAIPARIVVGVGRGAKVLTRDLLVSRGVQALQGVFGQWGGARH